MGLKIARCILGIVASKKMADDVEQVCMVCFFFMIIFFKSAIVFIS